MPTSVPKGAGRIAVPLIDRTQPLGQGTGVLVAGVDAMDHLGPAEMIESPVDGGGGALDGRNPCPKTGETGPNRPRRPASLPASRARDARSSARCFFSITENMPKPSSAQWPVMVARTRKHRRPGHGAADIAGGLLIGHHLGPGVEIGDLRRAQDEAVGFQGRAQHLALLFCRWAVAIIAGYLYGNSSFKIEVGLKMRLVIGACLVALCAGGVRAADTPTLDDCHP